jgi:bis(5'-adenosyl)-triphosphatase
VRAHQSADVLVCSTRPVPRLADLRADELAELMRTVQRVGRVVERAYDADGLTIACQVSSTARLHPPVSLMRWRRLASQDGRASGQTVPHVHFHVLPRRLQGDRFAGSHSDDIYPQLEKQEGALPHDLASASQGGSRSPESLRVDADAARKPRTHEDMEREAKWLAGFFEADK